MGASAKRLLDLGLALVLLLPALVLIVLACVAIRIETPGPALFWQDRVGRHRRTFRMLKLRTMFVGTEARGSHEIGPASVTSVGRFLRHTKLDELPQILSVLRGDMSFVGPRPCLVVQTQLIEERAERGVYEVRPGITGMAQLAGIDMSTPEALAMADAEYVRTRSLPGDISLIFKTALGRGRGDAAR